ncbi:VIT1/CCC1 transporter family protein [Yoonia sediminilitoris]|uniref:VIT1/CCC1 family predicted Fe2+/Mn2+ transporter n=1 Tax=Yoonia sediminilitoris TaxID=1286148 RepID=A0A2T6KIY9_9RHOB|nr:VIT1/CCC1 transporter family protein [Yoonia sediminilitoris]PUB15631.1 VIT1/CCC1 family predicted Fe2+/Mn2+ transporter [Yoonia sediminilitoris]RCW96240.1 VIT1/CCC1 family predicted Fe2+/Mn2+ transporter [Yoonia sediminilitoris]
MALEHGHSMEEIAARLDQQNNDSGRLRDAIFGGIDGTVTTFAIVAGVQGAGLSTGIVVALGLANVLADGFSMAAGNFSGTKALADDRRRLWAVEERHIAVNRQGELDELDQILARKGLRGQVRQDAGIMISEDKEQWISLMLAEEYGLPITDPRPIQAAFVIFGAFVAAGMLPLLPYLIGLPDAFSWSVVTSAACFFGIGAAKSRWSLAPWWKSGLETLLIGGLAAVLAFAVGRMFHP